MCHTPTNKAELAEFLEYEAKKNRRKNTKMPLIELGESSIIWKYIYTLRHAEYHFNSEHRLRYFFYRIMLSRLSCRYGIHIPINTCGKGLKIMHLGNILINGSAKIGKDCSIHINTSIVAGGTDGSVPVIGDNVVISVGAVILGKARIPNGCAIGANALVNKVFEEENIAIAGNPAKKISNNGKGSWK